MNSNYNKSCNLCITNDHENLTTFRFNSSKPTCTAFVCFFIFYFSEIIIIFKRKGYTELDSFTFFLASKKSQTYYD